MPNVHLITFGDGSQDYRDAANRLISSSSAFTAINFRRAFSNDDLGASYRTLFTEQIRTSRTGFGYFAWKPFLIHDYFASIDENDLLIYIDAGCELNPNGLRRFDDYLSLTSQHGSLLFELQFPNRYWTKKHALLAEGYPAHYYRNQIASGIFFLKKNATNARFCSDWLSLSSHAGGELLSDPDPEEPQLQGYRAHRHDQSTLSLSAYANDLYIVKDETYFDYWSDGLNFPILAFRNRTGATLLNEKIGANRKFWDSIKALKNRFRVHRAIKT